ncbi:MAG: DUF3015 family protein [Gammaproteobacteria bacterium]|nr:DUF3015 family protein [Gammaproteobacteria bacterium]MBQ0838322.1 DUF3015 family protein [Gammaproteobacteria bacterium]
MMYKKLFTYIATLSAILFLASCSITTAPTDASSATFGNTTDASSDLTSSTSTDEDDADAEEVEVTEFVEANFGRLRSDIAVGNGEYLESLASLLSIDDASKEQFYQLTKDKFNQLYVSSDTTTQELVSNIQREVELAKI